MEDVPEWSGGSGTPPLYPRLDPRLRQLDGPALQFWGDAAVREQALRAVLDAYVGQDPLRVEAALRVVDDAILAGMRALGFPRGPINGVRLRQIGALGQKTPNCYLDIDIDEVRLALTVTSAPESVVQTWLHESAHARARPWAPRYVTEMAHWRGYEEGFAEGCAQEIAGRGACHSHAGPYLRYLRGYQLLAGSLQVTQEDLYRQFWPLRPGSVRQAFTDVVDDVYHQTRGRHLRLTERRDVQALADEIFDSAHEHIFNRSVERRIAREWRRRLP